MDEFERTKLITMRWAEHRLRPAPIAMHALMAFVAVTFIINDVDGHFDHAKWESWMEWMESLPTGEMVEEVDKILFAFCPDVGPEHRLRDVWEWEDLK